MKSSDFMVIVSLFYVMLMPSTPSFIPFPYQKTSTEVLQSLRVQKEHGLSSAEVKKRHEEFGKNVFPDSGRRSAIIILLSRVKDPLILILIAAAGVSYALHHYTDAVIIALAILADITLHFFQAWRAERTIEYLQSQVKSSIATLRNGKVSVISASELALGDIIEIKTGAHVPADARIIRSLGLRTQESALTGEVLDIAKETHALSGKLPIANRKNMLFAGTIITAGTATAVVTSIGIHTEFGKIAHIITSEPSPETPLRRSIQKISFMAGIVLIICLLLVLLGAFLTGLDMPTTLRTILTLMVSAIPEDLTLLLTVALAVGMMRILKKGGVVRSLSSAETLGETTVICTDKTGTLTYGTITPKGFDFLQGSFLALGSKPDNRHQELVMTGLSLANTAFRSEEMQGKKKSYHYTGSSIERAALEFVDASRLNHQDIRANWKVTHSLQFSPQWKYRAAVANHPTQATSHLFVLGAPDILLEASSEMLNEHFESTSLTGEKRAKGLRALEQLGTKGYRLLGVAVKKHIGSGKLTHAAIHELHFLGVLIFEDPIRESVKGSVQEIREAGVALKLITGDHSATARAVARQIGIPASPEHCLTGKQLQDMDDKTLLGVLDHVHVFARVEPLDKQRLIRLLQHKGHTVAMTGDGINDAVALKAADIGVAMGSGTDVAKDAADLVLTTNSFSTIVTAIKEGRILRSNIRKIVTFLLATNFSEVAIFIGSFMLGLPLPLLPAQILWINIVTDGTSDVALCFEQEQEASLHGGKKKFPLPSLPFHIFYSGVVLTIVMLGMFFVLLRSYELPLTLSRTLVFATLTTTSLLSVWTFRSFTKPMLSTNHKNPFLGVSALFSFILQLVVIYTPALRPIFNTAPLNLSHWILVFGISCLTVLLLDTRKAVANYFLPKTRLLSSPHSQKSWLATPSL